MAVLASVLILVLSLITAAFYSSVINRSPIDPAPVHLPPFPKAEGVYAHNTLLQSIEKLGKGELSKPEDMAVDPTRQFLYTGTSDGWIKKVYISDGSVEDWKQIGGRPLGIAVGNDGEVIVCLPSQGLLKVTEEGVEVLATEVEGMKINFADGVTIAKDGLIYFTDASSKYGMENYWLDSLEGIAHGRILVYNPEDKSTKVLLKNLYFPNGITLSKDEEFLVICETTYARVLKYFLKGEKKGETETLIENLPGFPDNIHFNGKGQYYIGIIGARDAISDLICKVPFLKQILGAYENIFTIVDKGPKGGRVLVVDEMGKPVQMYEDPTAKEIGFVTGAIEVDGYLYAGGLKETFIGRTKVQ